MRAVLLILGVLVIVAGVAFFLGFNSAARRMIEQAGTEALGVPVRVSGLGVSLGDLRGKLDGITVGNPEGFAADKLLKAEGISVTLESASEDLIVISSVVVRNMTVAYEMGTAGSNLDRVRAYTNRGPASVGGPKVIIKKLQIVNAQVIPSAQGMGKSALPIPDITIKNLGGKGNPATASQIAVQIMNRIILSTSIAIVQGTLKNAVGQTVEGVREGLGGLKGILEQ